MRSNAIVVVLLLLATANSPAQTVTPRKLSGGTDLSNGAVVSFSTSVSGPDEQKQLPTQLNFHQGNTVSRVLVDTASGFWFGYDIEVEPVAGTKQFRYTIHPLNAEFEQKLRASDWFKNATAKNAGREIPLPRSTPAIINDGDTIEMLLMMNKATGATMTDLITVRSKGSSTPGGAKAPARDFTLDRAELKIEDYRLFVNGQMVTEDASHGGVSGALVWFYLPGHGRFTFSIAPRDDFGFEKTAVIERTQISFSANGNSYRWTSKSPIFCCGGAWNLWMKHEPDYKPEGRLLGLVSANEQERCCTVGAADRPEYLFSSPGDLIVGRSNATPPQMIFNQNTIPVTRNHYAPELYADALRLKQTLIDLPGAQLPDSRWEVEWQVFFVSEAEEQSVIEQRMNALPKGGGQRAMAWNPRPEDFPQRILLVEGRIEKTRLATEQDRTQLSEAIPFKARVPDNQRTQLGKLMTFSRMKIYDASLDRTFTDERIWTTHPFADAGTGPGQLSPRTLLFSTVHIAPDGGFSYSQQPPEAVSAALKRR